MTKLVADFNMEDERGRIPVLVDATTSVHVGETVMVADREGNRCKAVVADLSQRNEGGVHRLVAFVVPKPGTWERAS